MKHGILTPNGIVYRYDERGYATLSIWSNPFADGFGKLPQDIESLMRLAWACVGDTAPFTHLWVHPSCNLAFKQDDISTLLDTSRWDVGENGKFISVQKQGKWKGYIASITGRALSPRRTQNTRLIFLSQSNWLGSLGQCAPDELLPIIETIEAELGVPMSGSPTSVGLRFLEKMNRRYYDAYFEKSEEVNWTALKGTNVPFFAWFPALPSEQMSFLTPPEQNTKLHLHSFDRNGSHPFAASQEDMGVGKPYHQVGGEFDKRKPGLWQVEITGGQPPQLPPLFPTSATWLPTPILRVALLSKCFNVQVKEAFIWTEGRPVFERWAHNLWYLREVYPEGTFERRAYKSIMNNVIGGLRVGEEMDSTLRPDWYATVVGSERAVVWYKALKIYKEFGIAPIGAYADALFYLSPEEKPSIAVPTLLAHKDSLGGYKHAWSLEVTSQVRDILAVKMGAALRLAELKKLVKEAQ